MIENINLFEKLHTTMHQQQNSFNFEERNAKRKDLLKWMENNYCNIVPPDDLNTLNVQDPVFNHIFNKFVDSNNNTILQ